MTIGELWTRPHIARQMLAFHLDPDTHFASRPGAAIERIVDWLDEQLALEGKRICDLGCGPGLYATRMAERGALVTGVDFSTVAIAHAKSRAATGKESPQYLIADYLKDELPGGFDLVALIYYDYCALAPVDRHALLLKIRSMLNPGGRLVMDVLAEAAFADVHEQLTLEERLMNGFWSDSEYVGIQRTWLYPEQALSLDHYVIVEPAGHWEILNWMQYFSPERLAAELEEAGFAIRSLTGSLAGDTLTDESREIGVIADAGP
jgi:2-polyprenyl-3-methyl-5-hydroxy-6-metoxy-1,4-benzoquinol methylase